MRIKLLWFYNPSLRVEFTEFLRIYVKFRAWQPWSSTL